MNKLRLILTAIITAFFLLMVSCSSEPIEEPKQVVTTIQPIVENHRCTYTEQLPYVITEYSETNMQNDFRKYRKTTKINDEIVNVETYIISTQIPANLLNIWICE